MVFRNWEVTDYKKSMRTSWGEENLDCKGISYDCIYMSKLTEPHIYERWILCIFYLNKYNFVGREANLDSTLKIRDITLPTKANIVETMVLSVFMYRCKNWTIKKAKHQRTGAFELWCWRRLLRVPCTAGRSNQSILKEINPEYSLEGLMLKLKLQYFGHLMQRTDSLEKTLMLGKIEGRRRRG